MPDAVFSHPRRAGVYDALDPDHSDLDTHVDLVDELGATSVLDVGWGSGTPACRLADAGVEVLGLDPAAAFVEVARAKAGAEEVVWVVVMAVEVAGDRAHAGRFDLCTMSANVAQVFLGDQEWADTLEAVRTCGRRGGSGFRDAGARRPRLAAVDQAGQPPGGRRARSGAGGGLGGGHRGRR